MQVKGLFVLLLCCTEPEVGRFLLEDLSVARDYKKITEGKKLPSFLFSVNVYSPHVLFTTHNLPRQKTMVQLNPQSAFWVVFSPNNSLLCKAKIYFGPETLFFAENNFCLCESGIERERRLFLLPLPALPSFSPRFIFACHPREVIPSIPGVEWRTHWN